MTTPGESKDWKAVEAEATSAVTTASKAQASGGSPQQSLPDICHSDDSCSAEHASWDEQNVMTLEGFPYDVFKYHFAVYLGLHDLASLRLVSRSLRDQVDSLLPMRRAWQGVQALARERDDDATIFRLKHVTPPVTDDQLIYLFRRYCFFGSLAVVSWMHTYLSVPEEAVHANHSYAFVRACTEGHLDVAKFLFDKYDIGIYDIRASNNVAIVDCCAKGHVHVLEWLHKTIHLELSDVRSDDNIALGKACRMGQLASVKWLVETFPALCRGDVWSDNLYAFRWACKGGHTQVAQFLARHFQLDFEAVTVERSFALNHALMEGHTDTVAWLIDDYPFTGEHLSMDAFAVACKAGYVQMLTLVADKFELVPDTLEKDAYRAVLEAVRGGHLAVLEMLINTFSVDPATLKRAQPEILAAACGHPTCDVLRFVLDRVAWDSGEAQADEAAWTSLFQSGGISSVKLFCHQFGVDKAEATKHENEALRLACRRGHLSTAQWLVSEFALTTDDARAEDCEALVWACAEGHLETLVWLCDTFAFTKLDASSGRWAALRWACRKGHLPCAKYFAEHFAMTKQDLVTDEFLPLHFACGRGHLEVADWLVDFFDLTLANVEDIIFEPLLLACKSGNQRVAFWIIDTFRVSKELALSRDLQLFRQACQHDFTHVAQSVAEKLGVETDPRLLTLFARNQ